MVKREVQVQGSVRRGKGGKPQKVSSHVRRIDVPAPVPVDAEGHEVASADPMANLPPVGEAALSLMFERGGVVGTPVRGSRTEWEEPEREADMFERWGDSLQFTEKGSLEAYEDLSEHGIARIGRPSEVSGRGWGGTNGTDYPVYALTMDVTSGSGRTWKFGVDVEEGTRMSGTLNSLFEAKPLHEAAATFESRVTGPYLETKALGSEL